MIKEIAISCSRNWRTARRELCLWRFVTPRVLYPPPHPCDQSQTTQSALALPPHTHKTPPAKSPPGLEAHMLTEFRVLTIALFISVLLAPPLSARTLIEQAREAGTLDAETAALYQVYSVRDLQALPEAYREVPDQPYCGTPVLTAARHAGEQMSGAGQARLAKALARPVLDQRYRSPAGHFQIHYTLEGQERVDPTDQDDNGVPDYIDVAAAALDSTWALQVDDLGYLPPPPDRGLGGGDEYDAYIVQLGDQRVYGYTYPENNAGFTTYSYLELDNNYTDPAYSATQGLDALRVAIAHEFFHAIHFRYYQGNDSSWWREASSTWMEDVAYPEIDDYLQYVPYFLQAPERSLDGGGFFTGDYHIYGASIFAHFLDQRYGRDLIRTIWEELHNKSSAALVHFEEAVWPVAWPVADLPFDPTGSLGKVVSEFAVWNYFTGSRHRQGLFYREGEKYSEYRPIDLRTVANTPVQESDRVDHLGSAYIRLQPLLLSGGVRLETDFTRGSWIRQLILVSQDSVEVRPMLRSSEEISAWDNYDEVILVLVQKDLEGRNYEYQVSAEYDPELTDEVLPLAFRLRQSYPNPFRPEEHGQVVLPFDLSVPSEITRLSIFAVDGRLVRRFDLGSKRRRFYNEFWDGLNDKGERVGSGMYYYVLEADELRAAKTLGLVRD